MLCASLLAIVVDNTIVNVALPTLVRDLDADVSELQWVVDAYTLVFAGLLLLAGALGDRYGRRRTLLAGLAVFGAASAAAAYAGGVDALIAARAVMGAGAAFIMPATLSLLISVFTDERERATAIGIWAATAGLGVALGPVVGGFLLDHFWWGSIFIVNVPLTALALVAGPQAHPRVARPGRAADRLDRAPPSPAPAWSRWCGRSSRRRRRAGRPRRCSAPARSAAAALDAFVVRQRRVAEPLLDVRLFKDPRFTAASTHDHGAVLRALRVPVPVDAVPAVRARLLAVGRGRTRAALRGRDDRVRAAVGAARREPRDEAGRDRRDAPVRGRPGRGGEHQRRAAATGGSPSRSC